MPTGRFSDKKRCACLGRKYFSETLDTVHLVVEFVINFLEELDIHVSVPYDIIYENDQEDATV